jgi:hypothetical protein
MQRLQRQPIGETEATSRPPLYSYSHTYQWFRDQDWSFDADIRVWRSVSGPFLRGVRDAAIGRAFLLLLYWAEELAPRLAGRLGRFPMIVIHKRA